jgi:hypothetical protein
MNWYGNVSPRQRRIYNTLIGIIALTLPCYCLGLLALTLAPNSRAGGSPSTSLPALPTPTVIAIVTVPLDVTPSLPPTERRPQTITPTPTASATNTGTPTPTASATGTETATPTASATPTIALPTATLTSTATATPTATATLAPSPTPTTTVVPTGAPTATPSGVIYTLRLVTRGEDSLFVINDSRKAFPLEPLRLAEGSEALNGQDWNVDNLKQGECVAVWKNGGKPQPPDVKCKLVGKRLTRSGEHRFWLAPFNVYYQEQQVGTCADTACIISINPQ